MFIDTSDPAPSFPLEYFFEQSVRYESGNHVDIDFHKEWFGGVAMFGGMVAASMIRATKIVLENHYGVSSVPLRSVMLTFARKVKAENAVVKVDLIRKGNSVIQLQSTLCQDDEVACVGIYCFASRDTGKIDVPLHKPDVVGPDESGEFMASGRFSPEFAKHLDYRIAQGGLPFSGTPGNDFSGWLRFVHESDEAMLEEHLAIMADAWPFPLLQSLTMDKPLFAASLNWTLEFTPMDGSRAHDWWQIYSESEAHEDGLSHAYARLWSPQGKLSAISRQTFSVFVPSVPS